MLERLYVSSYRSLREVSIEFGQLTVVTGANGSGKSNLYRSLELVQAAAAGSFARALLDEGGMPSALWAGERGKGPVRMTFGLRWDDLAFEMRTGLPQTSPNNPFVLDPELKEEFVYLSPDRKPSTTLAERSGAHVWLMAVDGERRESLSMRPSESMLSQIGEAALYPELEVLQRRIHGWRFYHQFDTHPASPIRRSRPGVRTDALASDGNDLGAAVATIAERGDRRALDDAVASAFDGCSVVVSGEPGTFEVGLETGFRRPLMASELSDGQLRFLCLATALLSTRPPELLVLNEPETSLHPRAVLALAPLITGAARFSQVWVTTHDRDLARVLAETPGAKVSALELRNGETTVVEDSGSL